VFSPGGEYPPPQTLTTLGHRAIHKTLPAKGAPFKAKKGEVPGHTRVPNMGKNPGLPKRRFVRGKRGFSGGSLSNPGFSPGVLLYTRFPPRGTVFPKSPRGGDIYPWRGGLPPHIPARKFLRGPTIPTEESLCLTQQIVSREIYSPGGGKYPTHPVIRV